MEFYEKYFDDKKYFKKTARTNFLLVTIQMIISVLRLSKEFWITVPKTNFAYLSPDDFGFIILRKNLTKLAKLINY